MPCFAPSVLADANTSVTDLLFVHPFPAGSLYKPRNRGELVAAVMRTRDAGNSLRAHGSNWSLSPAGVARDIVDTSALNLHLSRPFPGHGEQLPANRFRAGGSGFLHAVAAQNPPAQGRRFVHVEAGIKIRDLLDDLAKCGSALPTMGDGAGQSLIGAISTGTHGGDLREPPLVDRIQALHLVSASGREIWITPSQGLFANSDLVTQLPDWCGDARFIADDTAFAAARLGVGRMGIVYSVVLEVVEQYTLIEANMEHRWPEMRAQLAASRISPQGATGIFDAPISDMESGWLRNAILQRTEFIMPDAVFRYISGPEKWPVAPAFFDQNPQVYRELLDGMRLDGLADDLRGGPAMPLHHVNLAISLPEPHRCFMRRRWKRIPPVRDLNVGHAPDDDLVAAVKANKNNPPGIVEALKERLEIDPFLDFLGWLTHSEKKERLDFYLDSEIANIAQQHAAIGATSGEALFIVLHRIANDAVLDARSDVARAAGQVIAGSFSRTARAGRASGTLGQNMLDAHDYEIDGAQAGNSGEFHFDAASNAYLDFIEDVIAAARRRHPVFGYIGVRFTPRSSALIAMQQYALTASVEVSTIRSRLEDVYGDFWNEVHDRARARSGIPHWGQEMRHNRAELEALYGNSLARWRMVLADLAEGFPKVFMTDFSLDKGLEPSSAAPAGNTDDDIEVFLLGLAAGFDDEPARLNRDVDEPLPVEDLIRALHDIGVDFSVQESDLRSWLANPLLTPYPAISQALLLLGVRLRLPVFLDVIAWNYENMPTVNSPRTVADVRTDVLKAAIIEGAQVRHGIQISNFDQLLLGN
ncbi:FAD-binding protein [Rhizobium laguerreae]|uniref:FAD-binding protein n=1 Tax=Rhizobium laguerreae TaxID=1076926 RepID=UPI001C90956C|nr:FAD-binding protein [Rhizobium laguerreae]MBY3243160.1 FAD-binding protein [Rhizobium laguerreae]